ncbi:MAG TPA: glycoside hydrolase family 71/99-like protein [Bosea sp. (in: a-proteobacteria)]|nr:glycoside hydrolase family 71/99-like protein [Bosea sp. (in: a-proteobacteria)]
MGYQGWFGCPGDGTQRGWVHWFRGSQPPSISNFTIDLWPDQSELSSSERCATGLPLPSGQEATLFSSANAEVVARHFQWMRQYDIDGAALMRFATQLSNKVQLEGINKVLRNVRTAAEAERRGFFIMYDLSGPTSEQLLESIQADWLRLTEERTTSSAAYIHHKGKPVVALWGIGFSHVKLGAADARRLVDFFKSQHVTVLGGVPTYWRTLERDARPEPEWKSVYTSLDVLSPWTVGRFRSPNDAAGFGQAVMAPDMTAARRGGQDYMPVVFPGFSWFNLRQGKSPLDQIPRQCGAFYQAQVHSALKSGADMLFTAMFDEADEGTAIFKLEQDPLKLPAGANLLVPDRGSGCRGGNDLYLKLAGEATRAIRAAARNRP